MEEHPNLDNHLCDAALYAWRWAYQYAWEHEPKKLDPTSEEAVDDFWERESQKLEDAEHDDRPIWERELEDNGVW